MTRSHNFLANQILWCYCSICSNFFPAKNKRISASHPPKAGRRVCISPKEKSEDDGIGLAGIPKVSRNPPQIF